MLNIRCAFCQTPYTLSRVTMLDALQEIDAHKLTHYNAQCPRCRRATQLPRQRLEMAMPNWRNELKEFEQEMKEHPQPEAPLPAHEPAPAAEPEPKPAPQAKAEKPAPKAAKEKPAAKTTAKKPATASKGKTTTKKSK
ncbi:MAG: hypothetical protein ACM33V_13920 [Chloroflexota bacterium]|nr:hypothetical protein [Anaerolineales bacterium]